MSHSEISRLTDSFNASADTYENRMGPAVRSVARHIALSIDLPAQTRVCDNACGTGAVTEAILKAYPDAHIDATDNSVGMIQIMSSLKNRQMWGGRVHAQVADSVKLPFAADTFDANIINFGIFFTSDEIETAREIHRTLKPGGKAIATCWKASALFQMIFDVQKLAQPANRLQSLEQLETWSKEETMKSVMQGGGFADVSMEAFGVDFVRPTLDELATSCAENFKGMVGGQWTTEEKGKLEAATKEVLTSSHHQYLSVNTSESKGVRWVAWIASATK